MCPQSRRREAWQRLARDLDRAKLAEITSEIDLARAPETAPQILGGNVRGRIVVKITE
jgi:acrylyl-CoA reductase (NADPH)